MTDACSVLSPFLNEDCAWIDKTVHIVRTVCQEKETSGLNTPETKYCNSEDATKKVGCEHL